MSFLFLGEDYRFSFQVCGLKKQPEIEPLSSSGAL